MAHQCEEARDPGHKIVTKNKKYHFLEIVRYTCNTTSLHQNLMGTQKNKKCKFPNILAATHIFIIMYKFDKRT